MYFINPVSKSFYSLFINEHNVHEKNVSNSGVVYIYMDI